MARGRRPSTTPYGRGPPPHGFAAGRIWMAAHLPKADTTASLQPRPILQQMARDSQRRRRHEGCAHVARERHGRSEEHTSELQSLMRSSYAVFCLKKKRHIRTSDRRAVIKYNI